MTEMQTLRPFQIEALAHLNRASHLVCLAPTGSGKTKIAEEFCLRGHHRCLWITPLVALGRQQGLRLRELGFSVQVSLGDEKTIAPVPFEGRSEIWILSPERLWETTGKLNSKIKDWRPDFLVVDECHCLWEWGESFRPEYAAVIRLPEYLSLKHSLWLSATLPFAAFDWMQSMAGGRLTKQGKFAWPNELQIRTERVALADRFARLATWLRITPDPGIVFCMSRKMTERLLQIARALDIAAAYYHAGLASEERRAIENDFRSGKLQILISTSAFGLGMDLSHLRWVVVWQLPGSLLALAQMLGRVGRVSQRVDSAWVFWDDDDFKLVEWIARRSPRNHEDFKLLWRYLSHPQARTQIIEEYFEGPTLDAKEEGDGRSSVIPKDARRTRAKECPARAPDASPQPG